MSKKSFSVCLLVLVFVVLTILQFGRWGFGERIVQATSSAHINDIDLIYIILGVILFALIAYYLPKNEKIVSYNFDPFLLSIGVLSLLIAVAYISFAFWISQQNQLYVSGAVSGAAIALSATLATIGWIVAAHLNAIAQRKNHTLNVLLQFRTSPLFAYHRANMYNHYDYENVITENDFQKLIDQREHFIYIKNEKDTTVPILDSIEAIANFYEFSLAAMEANDIDEDLLKATIRGLMVRFYKASEVVILAHRKYNSHGTTNTKTYELLEKYAREWYDEKLDDNFSLQDKVEVKYPSVSKPKSRDFVFKS